MKIASMAKAVFEKIYYHSVCDVITYEKVKDPITKRTGFTESVLYHGIPCYLSFGSPSPSADDNVSAVTQTPSLFLDPSYVIPSGSKVIVTQRGRMSVWKNSSEPRVYESHQEIALELFKGWS